LRAPSRTAIFICSLMEVKKRLHLQEILLKVKGDHTTTQMRAEVKGTPIRLEHLRSTETVNMNIFVVTKVQTVCVCVIRITQKVLNRIA